MANANQDDGSCLYQNATCDDGDANTINDMINGSCVCAGMAVGNGIYTQGNGVTDIDGNTYSSIIINGQEWMQQNLAVTKYRNGDPILTGLSNSTWSSTTSGAYAIYNNDSANNMIYGKLYNWFAVDDSRGLCPTGWHVPSYDEWGVLASYLGGGGIAGGKMKSLSEWNSPNFEATNSSGFSALPGGRRWYNVGTYSGLNQNTYFWTSTQNSFNSADNKSLSSNGQSLSDNLVDDKKCGHSVRCVRD